MITVHHLEHSRSQRILWLLEELGVPYQVVRYARDAKTSLAPASLRAIHPLGKAPVITDAGRVIAESGAIIEYLCARHGGAAFMPAIGTPAHDRYRYFMHYAEGSLAPLMLLALITTKLATSPAPFFVRPIVRKVSATLRDLLVTGNLARHATFLEDDLGDRAWLTGDTLTGADILMSFPLQALVARAGPGAPPMPRLTALVDRMQARPAYVRALAKGGPFELLG